MSDTLHLEDTGQCKDSGFVRHRYRLCGAGGPVSDAPVAVRLQPWTGQMADPARFIIVPRKSAHPSWSHWPASQHHEVKVIFEGVDSPAAWGSMKHGCSLLREETPVHVLHGILASADATCHLLSSECYSELCPFIDQQSLGKRKVWSSAEHSFVHEAPILAPNAVVQVLACMRRLHRCEVPFSWNFKNGELSLAGHGARMTSGVLLQEAMRIPDGMDFLQAVHGSCSKPDRGVLRRSLAQAAWALPSPSSELITTLAGLGDDMPASLLQKLALAKSWVEVDAQKEQLLKLRSSFSRVHSLSLHLEDATQLGNVVRALDTFAPKLSESFEVFCSFCDPSNREPLTEHWIQLFQHMSQVKRVRLELFNMHGPSVKAGFEDALRAATRLTVVELYYVKIGFGLDFMGAAAQRLNFTKLEVAESTPGAVHSLLQGLTRNENGYAHLKAFQINDNSLGPVQGELLPDVLTKMPNLQGLFISENSLGDALGRRLAHNIQAMKRLHHVKVLAGNNFSEDTLEKLKRAGRHVQYLE